MKRRLLLFIPMYNCEKQIKRVIGRIGTEAQEHLAEILVADNSSADGSLGAARQALAGLPGIRATLVRNTRNYSLGGSLKIAFNYCLENNYDHCIVLHGDDQADIGDILPCLKDETFFEYDCAFGSRFLPGSSLHGYSKMRILGNRALNGLTSLVGKRAVSDLGSGLNMYKMAYLKDRFYTRFPDNLTFDVYMLLYCLLAKASLMFFPISWSESDQKSNARAFRQGLKILQLLLQYSVNAKAIFAAPGGPEPAYSCEIVYSHAP